MSYRFILFFAHRAVIYFCSRQDLEQDLQIYKAWEVNVNWNKWEKVNTRKCSEGWLTGKVHAILSFSGCCIESKSLLSEQRMGFHCKTVSCCPSLFFSILILWDSNYPRKNFILDFILHFRQYKHKPQMMRGSLDAFQFVLSFRALGYSGCLQSYLL